MKTILKTLILLISITTTAQGNLVHHNNPKEIKIQWLDSEPIIYTKIVDIPAENLNKEHFQTAINGKKLERVIVGRKKLLGMKTKSENGLSYDQQFMIYDEGKEVYTVDVTLIYTRPTLTKNKDDYKKRVK